MTNAAMAGPVFAPQALQRCRSRRVSCLFTPLVAGGGGTRRARRCARQVPRSGGRRHQAAHGDDLSRMEVEGGLRRLLQRSKNCRPASAPGEGRLRLYLASLRQARGAKADPQITTVQINHEADSSFFRHRGSNYVVTPVTLYLLNFILCLNRVRVGLRARSTSRPLSP
jgi:hypothetical protein